MYNHTKATEKQRIYLLTVLNKRQPLQAMVSLELAAVTKSEYSQHDGPEERLYPYLASGLSATPLDLGSAPVLLPSNRSQTALRPVYEFDLVLIVATSP